MKLDVMILNEMNVKLLKIDLAVEREEEVNLANPQTMCPPSILYSWQESWCGLKAQDKDEIKLSPVLGIGELSEQWSRAP